MEDNINLDDFEQSTVFNSACVRKRANFGVPAGLNLIDPKTNEKKNGEPIIVNYDKVIHMTSPKLVTLLKNIEKLDKHDKATTGKIYKHFIFTDIKSSQYGAKIVGSALLNANYTLGYEPESVGRKEKSVTSKDGSKHNVVYFEYGKIKLKSPTILHKTKGENFYILCTTTVYDKPLNRQTKKDMLSNFNERPDNVYGENIRIIIMDSGFKEGIDLFDIKYVHVLEPQTTMADLKQVIGRGTRLCGQKGLPFDDKYGWPLDVFIYDLSIDKSVQPLLSNATTAFQLYLKSTNYDISLLNFQNELQETVIETAVDYDLNKNINKYSFIENESSSVAVKGGANSSSPIAIPLSRKLSHSKLNTYINNNFAEYKWDKIQVENLCQSGGGKASMVSYTKTQDFIRHYFTPSLYNNGMLLWHSVGTGKTCTAIATASNEFEKHGYTILWVTRTTLVNDIWKNMFSQVCNENLKAVADGDAMPSELTKQKKLLSQSWRIQPLSYKQFTNLISKKNKFYNELVKINGVSDPLRKTLLIIDEVHKLYGESDLSAIERPNMTQLHDALMSSYEISGKDSVKLLLMSATPITKDPMELIKLLNLCRPVSEQLPDTFPAFKSAFLNENGEFMNDKKNKFMDDIAGYVSYLDRSSDIRQFSQPKIHMIDTPIITMNEITTQHKRTVQALNKYGKKTLLKTKKALKKAYVNEAKMFKQTKKNYKKRCLDKMESVIKRVPDVKIQKKLTRTAKKYIVNYKKELITKVKDKLKSYKDKMKEKYVALKYIGPTDEEEKHKITEEFKLTPFYNLKYKCGETSQNEKLTNFIKNDDETKKITDKIEELNNENKHINDEIVITTKARAIELKELSARLNASSTNQEKNDIKRDIKSKKDSTEIDNLKHKIERNNKTLKEHMVSKNTHIKSLRTKTIKRLKQNEKEANKKIKEIKDSVVEYNDYFQELLDRNETRIVNDITNNIQLLVKEQQDKVNEKQKQKDHKILSKEAEKKRKEAEKQAEKEAIKKRKEDEKQAEKKRKEDEKHAEKKRKEDEKQAEKEAIKKRKEDEKHAEKEAIKKRKEDEKQAEKKRKEDEKKAAKLAAKK